MRLKQGVRVSGLKPEALLAINIADAVYRSYGCECIVTSIVDGTHSSRSHHYKGFAFDLRTRNVDIDLIDALVTTLIDWLGSDDFQVILEKDHIHVEFDPKAP